MSEAGHDHDRLRPRGGYRNLRAYQTATVIYDGTVAFCKRFIFDRKLREQMNGAARSGKQNISEGSRFNATSAETEVKLINVARSSQEELLNDYEDFLRQKKHHQWGKDDPGSVAVRSVPKNRPNSAPLAYADYAHWLDHADPAVRANCLICLIHQANYLLDNLITRLEHDLIKKGGYREQLTAARLTERDRQRGLPQQPDEAAPTCPQCNKPMRLRTARQGGNAGSQFWGCTGYPECKGTRKYQPVPRADRPDPTDPPTTPPTEA